MSEAAPPPRRSCWNEFALASSEAYLLLPSFPSVASSNERGRLLTCNGEAVIEREAMFAQAQRSEFL